MKRTSVGQRDNIPGKTLALDMASPGSIPSTAYGPGILPCIDP